MKLSTSAILENLKGIFSQVAKLNFEEAQQADGSIFQYADLEVGSAVFVNDEPAPDGDYSVDDKVISVKDGLISEVKDAPAEAQEPEVPQEEVADEPAEAQQPSQDDIISQLVANQTQLMSAVADLSARVDALEGKSDSQDEAISEVKDQISEGFSKYGKAPATPSKVAKTNPAQATLQSVFSKLNKK